MIEINGDKLMHNGMVIGVLTESQDGVEYEPTIVLNLGWCSMAGVHVRVLGDPSVDRKRDGVVLDR